MPSIVCPITRCIQKWGGDSFSRWSKANTIPRGCIWIFLRTWGLAIASLDYQGLAIATHQDMEKCAFTTFLAKSACQLLAQPILVGQNPNFSNFHWYLAPRMPTKALFSWLFTPHRCSSACHRVFGRWLQEEAMERNGAGDLITGFDYTNPIIRHTKLYKTYRIIYKK
jgi:hypothetical protein